MADDKRKEINEYDARRWSPRQDYTVDLTTEPTALDGNNSAFRYDPEGVQNPDSMRSKIKAAIASITPSFLKDKQGLDLLVTTHHSRIEAESTSAQEGGHRVAMKYTDNNRIQLRSTSDDSVTLLHNNMNNTISLGAGNDRAVIDLTSEWTDHTRGNLIHGGTGQDTAEIVVKEGDLSKFNLNVISQNKEQGTHIRLTSSFGGETLVDFQDVEKLRIKNASTGEIKEYNLAAGELKTGERFLCNICRILPKRMKRRARAECHRHKRRGVRYSASSFCSPSSSFS